VNTHRNGKQSPICSVFIGMLILGALFAGNTGPAAAQESSDLGRLFFTPERRQLLDRQRELNIEAQQDVPDDPTLVINGVVSRSSGKRTVWINGVPQNDNATPSGVSVVPRRGAPGRVIVQTSEGEIEDAVVGDSLNRNTGESTDILDGGSIRIHPNSALKR
jgi:hypothetical protein